MAVATTTPSIERARALTRETAVCSLSSSARNVDLSPRPAQAPSLRWSVRDAILAALLFIRFRRVVLVRLHPSVEHPCIEHPSIEHPSVEHLHCSRRVSPAASARPCSHGRAYASTWRKEQGW